MTFNVGDKIVHINYQSGVVYEVVYSDSLCVVVKYNDGVNGERRNIFYHYHLTNYIKAPSAQPAEAEVEKLTNR